MTTSDVKKWIETKMGEGYTYAPKKGTVKVVEDPKVRGTFAARFTDVEMDIVDLLFITGNEEGTADEILERSLEEVEYSSWPPTSSGLQFF